MNPTQLNEASARDSWTVVPYQSTHNTGGTIMGTNPREQRAQQVSAELGLPQPVRRRRQRVPAQRVVQPDRPVGALAYWTADAIKNRYVKNPGPLVSA